MTRVDGRLPDQVRPIKMTPNFSKHALGSCLVEFGDTHVLCNVSVDYSVPHFLRNSNQGWLTAEYAMLPASTHTRVKRERPNPSGRTQEIQRLIGRSLRGVIDLSKCPDLTFTIDCDVLQADGGTRTASITGAMVALQMAVNRLLAKRKLKVNPINHQVCAMSFGIVEDQLLADLNYIEDSKAGLDMNIVMLDNEEFLEIQGTGERCSFSHTQLNDIVAMAKDVMPSLFELQQSAAEGRVVEM